MGAAQLARWGLDQTLVDAVRYQHSPKRGELSAIVHVADVLAIQAGALGPRAGWCYTADADVASDFDPGPDGEEGRLKRIRELTEAIRGVVEDTSHSG